MFFILSKILAYLFRPVIWLVVLLVLALFHKKQQVRKRMLWAGFLILVLFTNTFLVTKITGLWAIQPKPVNKKFDVGIVLGGSTLTFEKKYNRVTYRGNIDRLLQAITLYRQGKIKKILVTGASGSIVYPHMKEAVLLYRFLRQVGIPDRNILMDTLAENTHENAVYSKIILQQHPKIHSVLLFTSSMHMRRALACFRHEGIDAEPFVTNLINTQTHWNIEYFLIPSASNFLIWNGMIHEMTGYATYKFMGYI
jgi:uncharacterized SAM-binding protein YcdF (DUF218 family)